MSSKARRRSTSSDGSSSDSSDDSRTKAPPEPDWECQRCTANNNGDALKCGVCDTRRPRQSLSIHAPRPHETDGRKKKHQLVSDNESTGSSDREGQPARSRTPQNLKRRKIVQSDSDDGPAVPSKKASISHNSAGSSKERAAHGAHGAHASSGVVKTESSKASKTNGEKTDKVVIKEEKRVSNKTERGPDQTKEKPIVSQNETTLATSDLANEVPRPASAASSASSVPRDKKLNLKARLALMQQAKAEQLKRIQTPTVPDQSIATDVIPSIHIDSAKESPLSTIEQSSAPIPESVTCEPKIAEAALSTSPSKPHKSPSKSRNIPKKVKWEKYKSLYKPPDNTLELFGWTLLRDNVYVETHPNGGAKIVHVFMNKLREMDSDQRRAFAEECITEFFRETDECAEYVMGIVHGGVQSMPNFLSYIADQFPNTAVVSEELGESGSHVVSLAKYYKDLSRTYEHGSHQGGQMRNISLVGTVQEESGGYFEDILGVLEKHDFTALSVPWGPMSVLKGETAGQSDDGIVEWRRGRVMEATALRAKAPREKTIPDRTNCHADFSGNIPYRFPVAAVGILQSCNPDKDASPIICKRVVAFSAKDMELVQDLCGLDFNEEPMDQSDKSYWIDDARLNQLRRMGATYAQTELRTGDLYVNFG